ncbi:ABC transporter ATP-binding protein [Streptomyces clavuligerus]|uniref:Putative ABC transporter ATP-binding protein n=1 Tax=Streptomyces clavuligerus TaxID=1901 RepID=E2QA99_STRCL|nr:ABC transporter ATP-binding protein [Streptomyces clavuligerus]ANW17679.1 ABC transporter ATP-binding protein [Streptomyces clavuligerus]AXU12229.1 ABC transporter ATP-binding protein [Streptomyces clavuligerus]EFG09798.1 Putative ABC transporter ATP-binding protein [Streptomyces clavuligerus]MBY6302100.1 ABC transporter ATP-binding protein [Streptomyces clavuligerus]QCS05011.1 ABC transporter ATP-binding protein [Streptomyces clavuligerus]
MTPEDPVSEDLVTEDPPPGAELTLDRLGVTVRGRALVRELSLRAGAGEVVGLVGPNGSGKSTALRCVYRALRPTTGAVRVDGTDLLALPPRRSARTVAALTQDPAVDLDFTVEELIALGRAPHRRAHRSRGPAAEQDLLERVMDLLDVRHLAGRGVLGLSGGERQRVLIARALAQEPRVLVLDEPTNHLDIRHQIRLLRLLREQSFLTVLVVLHDLNLAAAVCDRLAVLSEGRLVAQGTPSDVLTPGLLWDVFGVTATVVRHPATGAPQLLHDLGPRS